MKIKGLTDKSLEDLHKLIYKALEEDDAAPAGQKPYEVREHYGWKKQADAFEAEMDRRGIAHQKIKWDKK